MSISEKYRLTREAKLAMAIISRVRANDRSDTPGEVDLIADIIDRLKKYALLAPLIDEARKEIIDAYDEYVQLLGDELNELGGLATAHGWHSSRIEAGEKLRAKLAEVKKEYGV